LEGDYTLTVVGAVWHYSSYSPNDQNTSDEITLEYDFDSAGYETVGTFTFADFAISNNVVVYQTSINVASPTTGTFTLRPDVDTVTGVRGLVIRSACLNDGDDYPPQSGSGGGGTEDIF